MNASMDSRRVCELSAAELLEAALAASPGLGWGHGRWRITLHVEAGHVLKAAGVAWGEERVSAVGRSMLAVRRPAA